MDPPDSMPNSEVKRNSVDGSVGSPHVRVEHRQVLIKKASVVIQRLFAIYDLIANHIHSENVALFSHHQLAVGDSE